MGWLCQPEQLRRCVVRAFVCGYVRTQCGAPQARGHPRAHNGRWRPSCLAYWLSASLPSLSFRRRLLCHLGGKAVAALECNFRTDAISGRSHWYQLQCACAWYCISCFGAACCICSHIHASTFDSTTARERCCSRQRQRLCIPRFFRCSSQHGQLFWIFAPVFRRQPRAQATRPFMPLSIQFRIRPSLQQRCPLLQRYLTAWPQESLSNW